MHHVLCYRPCIDFYPKTKQRVLREGEHAVYFYFTSVSETGINSIE